MHACRALGSFRTYEANRLPNPLRDDLAEVATPFADGSFVATSRPGHGIEPRADLLERYALRPLASAGAEMADGTA